jgi:hypothetical protein
MCSDAGVMPSLADALKKTKKLTGLDISNNDMKAVHVQILAPALQDMGVLASLNLAGNVLGYSNEGPQFAEQIAAALPKWYFVCLVPHSSFSHPCHPCQRGVVQVDLVRRVVLG